MAATKALFLAGAGVAVASATVALVGMTSANAADLLPPPPMVGSPMPVQDFSGWYLRGDIGVGLSHSVKASNPPNPLTQGSPGYVPTAYNLNALNSPRRPSSSSVSAIRSTVGSAPT